MGYWEVKCRFCGVGFNIGRSRRPTEPRYKGWLNTADMIGVPQGIRKNCVKGKCWVIIRREGPCLPDNVQLKDMISTQDIDDNDDPADSDYMLDQDDQEDEYEELEFISDDEMISDGEYGDAEESEEIMGDGVKTDADRRESQNTNGIPHQPKSINDNVPHSPSNHSTQAWTFGWCRSTPKFQVMIDQTIDDRKTWLPAQKFYKAKTPLYYDRMHEIEHTTESADCSTVTAYNGNLIEFEEMRDCNVFQGMVRRQPNWAPESDDIDYESASRYVFTGLCGHMSSTDLRFFPHLRPIRYGQDSVFCNEYVWDPNDNYAMPFHPWCFDIYARLSRRCNGVVDVNGLMDWHYFVDGPRYGEPTYRADGNVDEDDRPYSWGHHEHVRGCGSDFWLHPKGTEYLAANPLFVPKLPALLQMATETKPDFDPRGSPFAESKDDGLQTDDFSRLPWELKMEILSHLSSKNIANLRLASRTFRHLPNTLWKHLLMKEMPWLWEVWCDDEPYFWAAVAFGNIAQSYIDNERDLARYDEQSAEIDRINRIIEEAYVRENPAFVGRWKKASAEALGERPVLSQDWRSKASPVSGKLPSSKTNWYSLYTLITRHWKDLKGLRNRARIWTDIERMMGMIAESRERGLISPLGGDPTF
ncbi:hypothetical protein EJ05DRAFT_476197 [Pseudovirgaria hyperparasitica]|uniref:F-box domain-containing protein n=1 Tax=Pseudovirgaria hyperparasitica TaxID=470096 RepID=A0A6A6W5M6_9PEZI|nr:uncharacterized protein EJ05DRAFT_476197 [Pseudovirgaria hyperparasitica]KAF2757903.1 hypothetical protein EJ05DRAFT_476197 [Pseudovirgaria hyperparasitica]